MCFKNMLPFIYSSHFTCGHIEYLHLTDEELSPRVITVVTIWIVDSRRPGTDTAEASLRGGDGGSCGFSKRQQPALTYGRSFEP